MQIVNKTSAKFSHWHKSLSLFVIQVSQDGYVYVGRGWSIQNAYADKSLAICFMGDYVRFEPSEKQLDGVRYLLAYGVTRDLLQRDYQLIAHNQVRNWENQLFLKFKESRLLLMINGEFLDEIYKKSRVERVQGD